jgi:alcohol dehydrogenase
MPDTWKPFQYYSPIEFVFGPGRLSEVPQRLRGRDVRRVLVVTDRGVVATGLVERLESGLRSAGLEIERFADIQSNPTVEQVDAGARVLQDFRADAVVAIGGGSPIDSAKIIIAAAANSCSSHAFMSGERKIERAGVPLVAIPTTAGTGAESVKVAVLSDRQTGEKKGVLGPGTSPWLAVLDPELTIGLPPRLTAATGMDALSHSIEAYVGRAATPFSDALAEQGIRLVARFLERAVADGSDLEARSGMLVASALGGLAKDQSGLGILHAVAMPIGYLYDLHHGYLCAALLPATLELNRTAEPQRVAWIARAFGIHEPDDASAACCASDAIQRLNQRIGLSMGLREAGVQESDHDRIVQDALASYLLVNNPVPGTPDTCRQILLRSL